MNVNEMSKLLGCVASMVVELSRGNTILVDVRILDAQMAYGDVRVQVQPVAGSGDAWVSMQRISISGGTANA